MSYSRKLLIAGVLLTSCIQLIGDRPVETTNSYETLRYYYPVPAATPRQTIECDVCVYGATPAGITAAIQAQRMGKSAVLVEFGCHVGGMTASGLSATDGGKTAGGIATEFYGAVGRNGFLPAAAEARFLSMLETNGVKLFLEHRLASIDMQDTVITRIAMENGNTFKAGMFIDATYEGDLMAMANVSFVVGREPNAQYGETINGIRTAAAQHQFKYRIDPYVTPGRKESGILPGITNTDDTAPGIESDGDRRIQAYNFRMFLAKMPGATPFPKPPRYDPERYGLLLRYITAGAHDPQLLVQLKTGDSNNKGGFSTDNIGMNYLWPEGGYEQREQIYQDHVTYQQGLMYFLTHDPRVPDAIRLAVGEYGLAAGCFPGTGDWPHQLYIREARRMVGDYVMTEKNCRSLTVADDSVGLAEYTMDSHNCQRYIARDKEGIPCVLNEGDIQTHIPHPYPISYRAIVPRKGECSNLLVPVCMSATHIAYGSIRMEPVFMVLGQSAGTAACLAMDGNVSVQAVPYGILEQRLLADKQHLTWEKKICDPNAS